MTEDRSSGTHRSPRGLWLIVAVLFVVLAQIVYGSLVFYFLGPPMAPRGQFGDLFGGVNALFTGLAFAGVIYTILLQRSELKLQREELRLTREELHRSADAQLEQVKRLEEAAELSAISTLVNTYGALLQPMRDVTHQTHVQMAWQERQLADSEADEDVKEAASGKIERLQVDLSIHEQAWSDTIQKHQELVERLETLVRQRSQGNGAAHKPE